MKLRDRWLREWSGRKSVSGGFCVVEPREREEAWMASARQALGEMGEGAGEKGRVVQLLEGEVPK